MSRREERKRERDTVREGRRAEGLEYREDCPCPKTSCVNHGYCGPCREKHKKSPPYCLRAVK